jgi:hypothetical protein
MGLCGGKQAANRLSYNGTDHAILQLECSNTSLSYVGVCMYVSALYNCSFVCVFMTQITTQF